MQGRRDFAFGLDQAKRAFAALRGPKQLWIGLHGHAPSSGVAADTPAMLAEGARWFDRFLRGDTAGALPQPVAIAPERWRGRAAPVRRAAEDRARTPSTTHRTRLGIARSSATGSRDRPARAPEVFGSPVRRGHGTSRRAAGRESSPCSARRTPSGTEIVVAGGGVPTRAGRQTYRIGLSDQATFVPRGSRLTVTIGSSSLAQNPGNLLYLDLPFASSARLRVTGGSVRIPALATPISG